MNTVCYGEILWDVFPDGKALGGAPLNVALRLFSLGAESSIVSRLGSDGLAEETRAALKDFGMSEDWIQTDENLETGAVIVTLDATGSASYEIKKPMAWDAIVVTDANEKRVSEADLFIFGSLVTRSETSRNTLKKLIKAAKYCVFDVNLRAPHYDLDEVIKLMKGADFVKMNDEELELICIHLAQPIKDHEEGMDFLAKHTQTSNLCVTRGSNGAMLLYEGKVYGHDGYPAKVVDTVGAGDSFLAGLLFKLFTKEPPDRVLDFACALGSLVAERKGANSPVEGKTIDAKMTGLPPNH